VNAFLRAVLYLLAALAAAGMFFALLSHVAAWRGIGWPEGNYALALLAGVFVVWLPAVILSVRLTRNTLQRDLWKTTLRGCPAWMKGLLYAVGGYTFVNLAIVLAQRPEGNLASPPVMRGLTGQWMIFYGFAGAILYSGAKLVGRWDVRCANGHAVSPLAKFCDQCGQPVVNPDPARKNSA
jgi:hypothetical protein